MEEPFFDFEADSPRETTSFQKKFDTYQTLCHSISKVPASRSQVSVSDILEMHHRKTSSGHQRRKKVTPLGKSVQEPRTPDQLVNEKCRDRIRQMIQKVGETRVWLDKTLLFEKVLEFCQDNRIVFPKSKEKIDEIVLYCLVMAGRMNGIFFDTHILSLDLNLKSKDINKILVENLPPLTDVSNHLIPHVMDIDKMCLLTEYNNILREVVESFNVTTKLDFDDFFLYERRIREIFGYLEQDDLEEGERQFCVTPDKVYIYGIFELIKGKNNDVTERSICDYLSNRFMVPRVTIEKMKRLVARSSRDK
jgi:hypothetical protein